MFNFIKDLLNAKNKYSSNRFMYIFVVTNCIAMVWFELIFGRSITWEFITLITTLISIVTGGKVFQKKIEKTEDKPEV